jgi:hypothetical protein
MAREEVAHVVIDEGTAQRCSPLEDNDIAHAEQILVLGLDRLDIPSATPELGLNPRVQRLVKKEFQRPNACCCRSQRCLARSASSWLSAINRSISGPYSA